MDGVRVPFAWRGARWFGTRASSLRVRCAPDGEGGYSVAAVDRSGLPVVEIESVVVREIDPGQLRLAARPGPDELFSVEWVPVDERERTPVSERSGAVVFVGAERPVGLVGVEGFVDADGFERALWRVGCGLPEVVLFDAATLAADGADGADGVDGADGADAGDGVDAGDGAVGGGGLAVVVRERAVRALEVCRWWLWGAVRLARLVFLARGWSRWVRGSALICSQRRCGGWCIRRRLSIPIGLR